MSVLEGMHHTLIGRIVTSGEIDSRCEIFEIFNKPRSLHIDLLLYLKHLKDNFSCSDFILIFGFVLIDKFLKSCPDFHLTNRNVHRMVFTSISIALKFSEDIGFSNSVLSKIGLVTTKELLKLETSFLSVNNWCIWNEEISKQCEELEEDFSRAQKKEISNSECDELYNEETTASFEELDDFSEISYFFSN
ncbi:unnamed protein product [Blepharisma stoltei]|uniref:Cyclin n=1 Tax=Blepharisma stoltei TaxID=1481888 RepID=A0AAU9JTF5_9CILI|nr:unnamed protein product [Blepharisma stoltei]